MYRVFLLILSPLILSLFTLSAARAIDIDPSYYTYPLEGVARLYSANFGELRPDHFHSGVDIKTDGVEGKRVVAAADGYVSRLGLSPYGYGLALYVTHPNGTTTVYGHLSRFRADIAERVQRERYAQKQHSVSLFFKSDEFPVKRGELIAYSGNSGSSAGPHLHYEIRETASQRPINPISTGVITPRDTRRPIFFKVHYMEVDTMDCVAYTSRRRSYTTANPSTGNYTLKVPNNEIPVGSNGYFVAEVSDRKDDVTNTFGIYSFEGQVDGETFFGYQMDGFTFDRTRYVNGVSCYALKLGSRHEVIRLAQVEGGTDMFYTTLKNRGVVGCEPSQRGEVTFVATDDCGLKATLKFNIVGREESFKAKADSTLMIIRTSKPFTHSAEGLKVSIPKGALYESIPFRSEVFASRKLDVDSMVRVVSPIYKILCDSIPLHKAMTISINAPLPEEDQPKAAIAKISRTGKVSFVGGEYRGTEISVDTRSAGEYFVAVDNTPPTITPSFSAGADLTSARSVSFGAKDNFSGVVSYNAYIDGEWMALEFAKDRLTHNFVSKPSGESHTIRIEVTDGCGNISSMERKFRR